MLLILFYTFSMKNRTCKLLTTVCGALTFVFFCSKPQQYKMAKYCEEILGDYLLKRPLDGLPVFLTVIDTYWHLQVNYCSCYLLALYTMYRIIIVAVRFGF